MRAKFLIAFLSILLILGTGSSLKLTKDKVITSEIISTGSELVLDTSIDMNGGNITGVGDPSGSNDVLNLGHANTLYFQRSGDVMKGNIDMDGYQILNLPNPSSSSEPATKGYVDSEVQNIGSGSNLSEVLEKGAKANQTIDMENNALTGLPVPVNSNDAVRFGYANSNFLDRSGDSMTGDLDLAGNGLKNVGNLSCGSDQVLTGDGSCENRFSSSDDRYIGNSGTHEVGGNINMNDKNIVTSSGNRICAGNQC